MAKILKNEEARRASLFSNNLRFIVRNGPVTRSMLAKRVGVTPNTIGQYMLGRVFPNEERIQQIAAGLGITVDELFDDTYAPWKFGSED